MFGPDPILPPLAPAYHAPRPAYHEWCCRVALPCARVNDGGCPEWVRPVAFDDHLRSNNAALARAGLDGPVPYSRWIQRVNREDAVGRGVERSVRPDRPPSTRAESRRVGNLWALPPRPSEVHPSAVQRLVETVHHAYTQTTMLPRGMTMDVLA